MGSPIVTEYEYARGDYRDLVLQDVYDERAALVVTVDYLRSLLIETQRQRNEEHRENERQRRRIAALADENRRLRGNDSEAA